jgi:hypothetical protein
VRSDRLPPHGREVEYYLLQSRTSTDLSTKLEVYSRVPGNSIDQPPPKGMRQGPITLGGPICYPDPGQNSRTAVDIEAIPRCVG